MIASLRRQAVCGRFIPQCPRMGLPPPRAVLARPSSTSAGAFTSVKFGPQSDIPGLTMGDSSAPAVVVIQEWWGVTDGIKSHARKIAAQGGYRVLIPDIYKGKIGVDAEEASHLMGSLDFAKAVTEISHAAAYLKETGSPRVGVVGFCMGGALTMGALAASKDLSCGQPFCELRAVFCTPPE